MNCKRAQAQREEWKKHHSNSVVVLAKSEGISVWIENVGVKKIERIVKCLMIIPPQNPGSEICITGIGGRVAQVRYPRPGHDYRQGKEGEKDQEIANNRAVNEGM